MYALLISNGYKVSKSLLKKGNIYTHVCVWLGVINKGWKRVRGTRSDKEGNVGRVDVERMCESRERVEERFKEIKRLKLI